MTNKEFIEMLSRKTNFETSDVKELSAALIGIVLNDVAEGDSVARLMLVRRLAERYITLRQKPILWCLQRRRLATR